MNAIQDRRGIALPLALFVLLALSALLLTFLTMSGMEPQVAANLNDMTRARNAAEAGMEWAYDQLILASAKPQQYPNGWNSVLQAGTIANNMTLPGLPATSGTFTVSVRNDNQANDQTLTGLPLCPTSAPSCSPDGGVVGGNATTDTNNAVILTSTGTYNGATRQIQAVVTHISLILPGSVNLYGFGTNTIFNGNSFTITGNDTNPPPPSDPKGSGSLGTCASRWGISVGDAATELVVEKTLSPQQKDNVKGRAPGDPQAANPGTGQGDTTIEQDTALTPKKDRKSVV